MDRLGHRARAISGRIQSSCKCVPAMGQDVCNGTTRIPADCESSRFPKSRRKHGGGSAVRNYGQVTYPWIREHTGEGCIPGRSVTIYIEAKRQSFTLTHGGTECPALFVEPDIFLPPRRHPGWKWKQRSPRRCRRGLRVLTPRRIHFSGYEREVGQR
jgi:hypothetical protein